jgi:hypothetical protein
MSLNGKRAEFVAALTTVDGVTGYAKRPTVPRAGDAWPSWRGAERDDTQQFVHTWSVAVVLPTDETAANDWIDDHAEEIQDALLQGGVAYTDGFDPANLGTDQSPVFGLLFSTRSE